jgi:hypothetical protein
MGIAAVVRIAEGGTVMVIVLPAELLVGTE